MRSTVRLEFMPLLLVFAVACASAPMGGPSAAGSRVSYSDPGTVGPVAGIGFESQDLVSMTDRMARDILANLPDATVNNPRRIILDAEYLRNEGSSRLNKHAITDRLRIDLNRSSGGRLIFVARQYQDMIENERAIKREGLVDPGTKPLRAAPAGADYRLGGRITTLDALDPKTGQASRYHQITFELIDLEKGTVNWGGMYDFRKSAQDDLVYY